MTRFKSKPKRKNLTKKVRFNVFKRDNFQCQYCGNTPPAVVLEVDHINPVSKGGDNNEDNLITSCFDCNRGKADGTLNQIPETIMQKRAVLEEKEAQIKGYNRLLSTIKARENRSIKDVENIFKIHFPGLCLTKTFKESVRCFIRRLPKDSVMDAMNIAGAKFSCPDSATAYFCGICWRKIKRGGNG